jgi:hypothetical protein
MGAVSVRKTAYRGWENCLEMSNGTVTLVITTDVGPRIMSYGFTGRDNQFFEEAESLGARGGAEYRMYGGHRLWHAPQLGNRPNEPANDPVEYEAAGGSLRLRQKTEPLSRMDKEIILTLAPEGTEVTVKHRLVNRHVWPVRASAWALTCLAPGGVEIIPWDRSRPPDYLPQTALVYWPWTKPNDPRLTFLEKYLTLRQDPENGAWCKIGLPNREGWAAYINRSVMFVKTFTYREGAEYPDWLCSFETFADERMVEIESLSPLVELPPEGAVESEERWYLFDAAPIPENEADIDRGIAPLIRGVKGNP